MTKEKHIEFDDVAPDASSIIESLRAHGYTLSTAIADIIDNSIAAKCRNVWLRFEWDGDDSWISITDDGLGMTEIALRDAMRLGSKNPLEEREPEDLGRFGLGLKTASFSQARRLTVITKTAKGRQAIRRWDLDHLAKPEVSGWQLLKSPHPDTGTRAEQLKDRGLESGTVILLELMDRVLATDSGMSTEIQENHFVAEADKVRHHLAMVFHRFLAGEGAKRVKIHLGDSLIDPWDPFCRKNNATQPLCDDSNSDLGGTVRVKGFVLPHRDKFDKKDKSKSAELHKAAAGPAGWNAHQGIYLYRNRRLIIPGDWLGLGPGRNGWKKEEHYKLARIRVDIPNSMDQEWQIDVKKSTALAPPVLASWLQGHAATVRNRAKEVYSHRGGYRPKKAGQRNGHASPWVTKKRRGMVFSYQIDRKNPILKPLIDSLPSADQKRLETLLRLVEETVPVQQIWIDTAENQEGVASPFEGESSGKLKGYILTVHDVLCSGGIDEVEAWNRMAEFEAFRGREALALIGILKEESC